MSDQRQSTAGPRVGTTVPIADQPAWTMFATVLARTTTVSRSAVGAQLATTSFVGNRARAQLDVAARITQCRSPQDLAAVQMAFWQETGREYMAFATEVTGLWQRALGFGFGFGLAPPTSPPANTKAPPQRDLIRVPDAVAAQPQPAEAQTDEAPRHAA